MPINIPGLLVPFQLVINPRVILPSISVKDIRHIDFVALRKSGYRGAVFDKDNCITLPRKDTIVPELQEAWRECREAFGEGNILIVSNSAGTRMDPGGIQCESVTHNTRVPVLRHDTLKPAYSCIKAIRGYFSSLRSPIRDEELIIVGDRVFTDVVMANRMRRKNGSPGLAKTASVTTYGGAVGREDDDAVGATDGPLAIWTTDVWEKEGMVMRWCEKVLVGIVHRWTPANENDALDIRRFVKHVESKSSRRGGMMERLFSRIG